MYFQRSCSLLIDRALIRIRQKVLELQVSNNWRRKDQVCFFQTPFPLHTASKPGTGHPGPTEHYLNGLLTFIAGQLATRLAHPAYTGRLIKPDSPGVPELWSPTNTIVPAVPPEMVLPPVIAPRFVTEDLLPVRKKNYFSCLLFLGSPLRGGTDGMVTRFPLRVV